MKIPIALIVIDMQKTMGSASRPPGNNPGQRTTSRGFPAPGSHPGTPWCATFALDKKDFCGTWRSAEDVHLMALANLHDEYAQVLSTDDMPNEMWSTEVGSKAQSSIQESYFRYYEHHGYQSTHRRPVKRAAQRTGINARGPC